MAEVGAIIAAAAVGFGCGFWIASELGRHVYNQKMDEIREKIGRMEDLLHG